jgi:hypothetical protein
VTLFRQPRRNRYCGFRTCRGLLSGDADEKVQASVTGAVASAPETARLHVISKRCDRARRRRVSAQGQRERVVYGGLGAIVGDRRGARDGHLEHQLQRPRPARPLRLQRPDGHAPAREPGDHLRGDLPVRPLHLPAHQPDDEPGGQRRGHGRGPAGSPLHLRPGRERRRDGRQRGPTPVFAKAITLVPATGLYRYDSLYRLIASQGREHPGQQQPTGTFDIIPANVPAHPSDVQALVQYIENYTYDQVGNIQKIVHTPVGSAPGVTWTRNYQYDTASSATTTPTPSVVRRATCPDSHDRHRQSPPAVYV